MVSAPAKVFAIFYAVFSGFFFLTMAAVLLAPALKHFLHRFHLELAEHSEPKHHDRSLAEMIERQDSAKSNESVLRLGAEAFRGPVVRGR